MHCLLINCKGTATLNLHWANTIHCGKYFIRIMENDLWNGHIFNFSLDRFGFTYVPHLC